MELKATTTEGTYTGVLFQIWRAKGIPFDTIRDLWRKSILEEARRQGIDTESGLPFITITMPCGTEVIYQSFEDIPNEDVPCPCGNPNHWVIQYRELEDHLKDKEAKYGRS